MLRLIGASLLALSLASLTYLGYELVITNHIAARRNADTVKDLRHEFDTQRTKPAAKPQPVTPQFDIPDDATVINPPANRTPFGILRVPRFGTKYAQPIVQGVDLAELGLGIGHSPGTAMPGQIGNLALAGHRTTYDRPLHDIAKLRKGDKVVVETASAVYTYTVTGKKVVKPEKTDVFAPVPERTGATPTRRMVTLASCHPFGSWEKRYVVFGTLTAVQRMGA